jgi:hypothetical protein
MYVHKYIVVKFCNNFKLFVLGQASVQIHMGPLRWGAWTRLVQSIWILGTLIFSELFKYQI